MRVSILIPCHNEEKSIQKCVASCLDQTRPADEIIVVNDGSTDKSGEILATFGKRIKVITIPVATGNKSHAQQRGLEYVTGDIFIATDGDTLLNRDFVAEIAKEFEDPKIMAVGGCVNSLKINWLTSYRAYEYCIGQNLHKLAQSYMDFMFVIPGAAGGFRTSIFKEYIHFDHDTITEDLDFTYKFHKLGFKIGYNRNAISYTQDPTTMHQYINQTRRWYGGGFQNLIKHFSVINHPVRALELSLIYIEGLLFSALLIVLPFINIYFAFTYLLSAIAVNFIFAIWAASKEKRWDLLLVPLMSPLFMYLNSWIFLEQFIKEVVLGRKNLVWFQPDRVNL